MGIPILSRDRPACGLSRLSYTAESYVQRSRWSVGNAESEKGVFMEELLQVGVITSTHGVRGEVKVFPTTDDPNRFKSLKHVLLDTGREKNLWKSRVSNSLNSL